MEHHGDTFLRDDVIKMLYSSAKSFKKGKAGEAVDTLKYSKYLKKGDSLSSLLHRWMAKKPSDWKPGAWDYDKQGAQLVEDTAKVLEIEHPWKE